MSTLLDINLPQWVKKKLTCNFLIQVERRLVFIRSWNEFLRVRGAEKSNHSDGIISFSRLISRRIDVLGGRRKGTSTITHCLVCCHSDDFDVTLGGHTARNVSRWPPVRMEKKIFPLQSRGTRNRYPLNKQTGGKENVAISFHLITSLYVPVEAHLTDGIAFPRTVMELWPLFLLLLFPPISTDPSSLFKMLDSLQQESNSPTCTNGTRVWKGKEHHHSDVQTHEVHSKLCALRLLFSLPMFKRASLSLDCRRRRP